MNELPPCMYQYRDHTTCPHSAKYLVQWAPFIRRELCSKHVYVGLDEGIAEVGRASVTRLGVGG